MSRVILDASVAMAWCFPDEGGAYAHTVLRILRTAEALVPSIWSLEVGNALLVAERRRRLKPGDAVRFLGLLEGLSVEVDPLTASKALHETISIARERGLSVYDAAYLELAMREGLPLATLDRDLKKAAEHAGVKVLPQT